MHAIQRHSSFHNKLATWAILLFYVTSAICLFIASKFIVKTNQMHQFPKFTPAWNCTIWIWEQQDWEVDQEIDGKMRWERIEEKLVGQGERKKYIKERNGRRSWERQGIVEFCTYQWNEMNEWLHDMVLHLPIVKKLHRIKLCN